MLTKTRLSDVERVQAALPTLLAQAAGGVYALLVNGTVHTDDAFLNHGDILAIAPCPCLHIADGEIVLLRKGGRWILRRVLRDGDDGGRVRLEPLDPRFAATDSGAWEQVALDQLDIEGRVTAVIRRVEAKDSQGGRHR